MPRDMPLNIPVPIPRAVDAGNKFEDLSGIDTAAYENPYDALLDASHGDPVCNLLSHTYICISAHAWGFCSLHLVLTARPRI